MLHRNPITINTLYKGTLSLSFRWELSDDVWRLFLFFSKLRFYFIVFQHDFSL